MKDYEILLKAGIDSMDAIHSVNGLIINANDRILIEKLKDDLLIENVSYFDRNKVSFDLTYRGLHYFD